MKIILKLSIALILTIKVNLCFPQVIGKCFDNSGNPIPFLNISVKKSITGTVTDENGIFILKDDLQNDYDSLVFTHIGYKMQTVSSNSRDTIKVIMQLSEYQLREVNIRPSDYIFKKEKIIGTKTTSDHVVLSFLSNNLGTEIGKIIEVKKNEKYKINIVYFHLSKFNFKNSTFRINFYKIDKNKIIDPTRANYSDIIKKVNSKGLIEIDVSNDNLEFENDFLVSIEWLDFTVQETNDENIENNIFFSSTVFSGPLYFRGNNLLKWKELKGGYKMGLGIHLSVKY